MSERPDSFSVSMDLLQVDFLQVRKMFMANYFICLRKRTAVAVYNEVEFHSYFCNGAEMDRGPVLDSDPRVFSV